MDNLTSSTVIDTYFSEAQLKACKELIANEDYDKLRSACKEFTTVNLKEMGELAKEWILLFQIYFKELSETDFEAASTKFKEVFGEKSIEVLFLKELLPTFKGKEIKKRDILLITRACRMFSERTLRSISRGVALGWATVIAENASQLKIKDIRLASSCFYRKFSPKPGELNTRISKEYLENCKESIDKEDYEMLTPACKQFIMANLKEKEELAGQWMVLFLSHIDKLSDAELEGVSKKYEEVFGEKTMKVLLLKELLSTFKGKEIEKRNILLITRACQMFSEEILQSVGREIALGWMTLIEKYASKLEIKDIGLAFSCFYKKFTTQPGEISTDLSKKYLEDCKGLIIDKNYEMLAPACKDFIMANLKEMEELATQWMVLFLSHIDKLSDAEFESVSKKYEEVFGEKKMKTLLLKEFLPICQEQEGEEVRNSLLITRACQMFSEESLQFVGREIARGWMILIAKYASKLDIQDIGFAFSCFYKKFTILPKEISTCISKKHLEDYKGSFVKKDFSKLTSTCKDFIMANLKDNEKLAKQWMVLFLSYIDKLSDAEREGIFKKYEEFFGEKSMKILLLQELLPTCQEQKEEEEPRNILLTTKACQMFSEGILEPVGRQISLSWMILIAKYASKLDLKDLEFASSCFYQKFPLRQGEISNHLSKMDFGDCKGSKINSACKEFIIANLKEMEELARQWMVLFLCHIDKLSDAELEAVSKKYEGVFGQNSMKVLLLKELLPLCKGLEGESRNILLITRACQMFSEETLQSIDREIALGWMTLMAKYASKLDVKDLGSASSCFYKKFPLNPGEISTRLSKEHLEDCNGSIVKKDFSKLTSTCKDFVMANLKEMEELARQWMVLFLCHIDKLSDIELEGISKKFEEVFGERSFKVLLLKELLSTCQEQENEARNILLITRACQMFSDETLQFISREIALGWAVLFAKYLHKIEPNCLGFAFSCLHREFTLQPGEISENIDVVYLDGQAQELPLALLLTYEPFRKRFTVHTNLLRLENTTVKVGNIFDEYLYTKKLPKNMTSTELVQLLDIARTRWIQDGTLMELCLEKIKSIKSKWEEYLIPACTEAIAGDRAFNEGNFQLAKDCYSKAIERKTDFLSYAALGKMAMKEKKYRDAEIELDKALVYAPFRRKLRFHQAKALVEYVKQFEKTIREFSATANMLNKKMIFKEKGIKPKIEQFLELLQGYFLENNHSVREPDFLQEITTWLNPQNEDERLEDELLEERLKKVHQRLDEMIPRVKTRLLSQAELFFEKMHSDPDKEMEKYSIVKQWLLGEEILYERGDFEKAGENFKKIETTIEENNITLNCKEKIYFYHNLAKLSMANGQTVEAKKALTEACMIDPRNEEISRSFMLSKEEMYSLYRLEFKKQDFEAQFKLGEWYYYKKDYEKAKEHFLNADPDLYHAYVNYYLGKIEKNPTHYFQRALKVSLLDNLELSFSVEIAEHFLENGNEEKIFSELVALFSQLDGDAEKRSKMLFRLAEKIEDNEVKGYVIEVAQELMNAIPFEAESDDDAQKVYVEEESGTDPVFSVKGRKQSMVCTSCLIQKLDILSQGEVINRPARFIDEEKLIKDLQEKIRSINARLKATGSPQERSKTLILAKPMLNTMIDLFPKEIEIKLMYGKICMEQKQFDIAVKCFAFMNQLKESEVLMVDGKTLLGRSPGEVLLEAKKYYEFAETSLKTNSLY